MTQEYLEFFKCYLNHESTVYSFDGIFLLYNYKNERWIGMIYRNILRERRNLRHCFSWQNILIIKKNGHDQHAWL